MRKIIVLFALTLLCGFVQGQNWIDTSLSNRVSVRFPSKPEIQEFDNVTLFHIANSEYIINASSADTGLSSTSTIAPGQNAKNRLFVFVGEKISVTPFDPKVPEGTIIMDNAFKAKYKVIESVFGAYENDTIEFEVYDPYGEPPFSKFEFALLYVSRGKDGTLYHEKYMYSDVYKTIDGRWAGPYESQDYNHDFNKNTTVKPEPVSFKKPVSFDVTKLDKKAIKEYYPEPYFKIKDGRAYVEMGNYVGDLFKLKRDGFLKARGLF